MEISLHEKLSMPQRLVKLLVGFTLLAFTLNFVGSVQINGYQSVVVAVILFSFVGWFIQPVFDVLAKRAGLAGVIFTGLFSYPIIVYLTLYLTPGISTPSLWADLAVAWIFAILLTFVDWAFIASTREVLVREAVKGARRRRGVETIQTGFVFVQLDGVSYEVLNMQLRAGNLPNIAKLINKHNYELTQWKTQLPSTTPASQAGILHGSLKGIPAFRWYSKKAKKLVVANQADGAAQIERSLSDGGGLLADGGVSIGNLFSGDAEKSIMVMSKLGSKGRSLREISKYSNYFATPYGFMRSLILSVGEMIKELYQSKKQERLDMRPRVRRKLSYVALRAVTNVLLRDIQTTIVIDQMMQGVNSVYVDYLDYDEVAHHAGLARPESIQSLIGLDGVVGSLFAAKSYAPRPYEIVFVSDHGQAQGPTFKQLNEGESLAAIVQGLCGDVAVSRAEVESSITDSGKQQQEGSSDIEVTGSGNLGNIWFKSISGRATQEQIEAIYPGLIDGLLTTEGIGFLIIRRSKHRHVVLGNGSELVLETGERSGTDPLHEHHDVTVDDLLRLTLNPNAPDIAIISDIHDQTGEVFAFEELVGNHGGAGGWQRNAILLRSKNLIINQSYLQNGELRGSDSLHRVFIEWLEAAGQRLNLPGK